MTFLKSTLLAAAATVAVASAAYAADPIMPAPVMPVAPMASAFDWNGFYAGASAGALNHVDLDDTFWTLGAQAGVNAQFDFFLIGAEVSIDGVFADDETYAYGAALARGGVVFDKILAYGAIGYGSDFDSDSADSVGDHVLAGGGLEFAATDNVSIRGQYLYGWSQDDAVDTDIHKFTIGANFHF